MNSEREKREAEIEKLKQGAGLSRDSDVAFKDEVKKATSAIVQEEISRIQRTERAEQRKRSIRPTTTGLWLLVLGAAGVAFSMPGLGAALIVCGIVAIVWDTVWKPSQKSLSRHSIRSIINGLLKKRRL
jgi:hypothetical protein